MTRYSSKDVRHQLGWLGMVIAVFLPAFLAPPYMYWQTVVSFRYDIFGEAWPAFDMMYALVPLLLGLVGAWKIYWRFVADSDKRPQIGLIDRLLMLGVLLPPMFVAGWAVDWAYDARVLNFDNLTETWAAYTYYGIGEVILLLAARLAWQVVRTDRSLFTGDGPATAVNPDSPSATAELDPPPYVDESPDDGRVTSLVERRTGTHD